MKNLQDELNEIRDRLAALKKQYGDKFEAIYMASSYEDEKKKSGVDFVTVVNLNNYNFYYDILENFEENHKEWVTYKDLIALKEFRVICIDDEMTEVMAEIFDEQEGDWPEHGQEYVVKKVMTDKRGKLTFEIHDGDHKLFTPDPYVGYASTRFEPINYALLN